MHARTHIHPRAQRAQRGGQRHLERLGQVLSLEQGGQRGHARAEARVVEVGLGDEGLGVHLFLFLCWVMVVFGWVWGVWNSGRTKRPWSVGRRSMRARIRSPPPQKNTSHTNLRRPELRPVRLHASAAQLREVLDLRPQRLAPRGPEGVVEDDHALFFFFHDILGEEMMDTSSIACCC